MSQESFAEHAVAKMERMLEDFAMRQDTTEMYKEMNMAQDRGEDVQWSEQEMKDAPATSQGSTKLASQILPS